MKQLSDEDYTKLESRIATRKAGARSFGGYGWWSDDRGIRQDDGANNFELLVPITSDVIGFVLQADPKSVLAQCEADEELLVQLRNFGAEDELFDAVLASLWARYPATFEEQVAARSLL